jgi:hypothetical protein
MKNYCLWCFIPIDNTQQKYEEYGNICSRCSGRCSRVLAGLLDKDKAVWELKSQRERNIEIYGRIEKRGM